MLIDFIEFLRSDDNRKILGWLGGGLAVGAGGFWTVVKFILKKNRPDDNRSDLDASDVGQNNNVKTGIQLSNNIGNITVANNRIGYGLTSLAQFYLSVEARHPFGKAVC